MTAAGLLAQELKSLGLDESNDDILLEDFDFEIVEEDVSLSAAPCEVSEVLFQWSSPMAKHEQLRISTFYLAFNKCLTH